MPDIPDYINDDVEDIEDAEFYDDDDEMEYAVRAYDCRCGAMRLTAAGPIQGADCVCT